MSSSQSSKTTLPLMLVAVGIALAGAGVWLAVNQSQADSPVKARAPVASSEDGVVRLTAEESQTAFQSGQAIILDVRGAQYYETQHIGGALNIPLDDLEGRLTELDPDLHIITYCT